MLPQITPSSDPNRYGEVAAPAGFAGIPLTGILGDQQAAMFGLVCFDPGEAKNTYGTGNFMLLNTGTELVRSSNGLLSTVCYQVGTDKPVYALEGSIAVTGSAVQWLGDQLGIISGAGEIEALAAGVKDNGGVTVNDLCMQLQANVVGVPVSRPLVAGRRDHRPGRGIRSRPGHRLLEGHRRAASELERVQTLDPQWSDRQRATGYAGWKKAVERTLDWVDVT